MGVVLALPPASPLASFTHMEGPLEPPPSLELPPPPAPHTDHPPPPPPTYKIPRGKTTHTMGKGSRVAGGGIRGGQCGLDVASSKHTRELYASGRAARTTTVPGVAPAPRPPTRGSTHTPTKLQDPARCVCIGVGGSRAVGGWVGGGVDRSYRV